MFMMQIPECTYCITLYIAHIDIIKYKSGYFINRHRNVKYSIIKIVVLLQQILVMDQNEEGEVDQE
jgi:hypothetical protein